jgi:beta-N-acetylhexosaminidase
MSRKTTSPPRRLAITAAIGLVLAAAALATATRGGAADGATTASPTLAQMVGQRMLVSFHGTTAGHALLARIHAGQIGGVILFGSNITDATQLTALTRRLQASARLGGQPRLLIATDQEGGLVRRLGWAPPKDSAKQLGQKTPAQIKAIGQRAGAALLAAGVNFDLAPVADVPRSASNFIGTQQRAFSTSRFVVAKDATAFAQGLEAGGVLPAFKHFPGLGRAGATSTDDGLVTINATTTQISRDLRPYRVALAQAVHPVIMLSTAVYPAYSPKAAAWSRAIDQRLLRTDLGFRGVTITDSLSSAAAVRGTGPGLLAVRCAKAGVDLLLVTGSQDATQQAFEAVLAQARSGAIPLSNLQTSYARILKLKTRI